MSEYYKRFDEADKLKIAPSENELDSNIETWEECLMTAAKGQFGHYADVILNKVVPEAFVKEFEPTPEQEARGNEIKRYGEKLNKMIDESKREVRKWNQEIKPKMNALIQNSLSKESTIHIKSRYREEYKKATQTDDIVKMLELIRLAHVQSGKVTTEGDKEAVRAILVNFKRNDGERLNEFAGRWALLEKKMFDTGLDDVKHSTKVSVFLGNMRNYPIANIEFKVVEMLRNPAAAPPIADIISEFQEIIQASGKESNDIKSSK